MSFKAVVSLLITFECVKLSILYWNTRWNIALKKFSDGNQCKELSNESPSGVPWLRYNWLQKAPAESIQQLSFCLYENFDYILLSFGFILQTVLYSCQIQICDMKKYFCYMKIPCDSCCAAAWMWLKHCFDIWKTNQVTIHCFPKKRYDALMTS